ncbi:HIT-like protein [Atractiella rhizophila]|nr:HIT-like protein [Atractiella rhizophila]
MQTSAPASSAPTFSTFPIDGQIFFASPLTLGIVNLMPIVPGHVLVIPKRVEPRFGGLSKDEVADLWLSVHRISSVVERAYSAGSLTIAIQDGPLAGQTVPHVHVHILPRHPKDFEPMDKVYDALETTEKDLKSRYDGSVEGKPLVLDPTQWAKPRSKEEMLKEAKWLEGLFEEGERWKAEPRQELASNKES